MTLLLYCCLSIFLFRRKADTRNFGRQSDPGKFLWHGFYSYTAVLEGFCTKKVQFNNTQFGL